MRVRDAEDAVYDGLRGLDQFRYLRAMWMIGGELLSIYEDRTTAPERTRIAATLDLVRAAAIAENVTSEMAERAEALDAAWETLIDNPGETVMTAPATWPPTASHWP